MAPLNRRDFLKRGSMAVAAAGVASAVPMALPALAGAVTTAPTSAEDRGRPQRPEVTSTSRSWLTCATLTPARSVSSTATMRWSTGIASSRPNSTGPPPNPVAAIVFPVFHICYLPGPPLAEVGVPCTIPPTQRGEPCHRTVKHPKYPKTQ